MTSDFKVSPWESKYKSADSTFLVNNDDPDLRPIRISLPKAPPIRRIDGYGLKPSDQRFKRLEIPRKLRQLEEEARALERARDERQQNYTVTRHTLLKRYWDLIYERREDLVPEIEWLKRLWWYIINGYWFFNRGKPTYITGWHFFYLNFWYIPEVRPDGYPEYRDRNRKEFLFHKYAHETTETFRHVDKNGWAIPEPDGTYKMKNLGRRVCYGVGQPKNRRGGNTNMGLNIVYIITALTIGTDGGGIMSYTADNAEKHFTGKLVAAMNKMPFFVQPFSTSHYAAVKNIKFGVHPTEYEYTGLNNELSYAETAASTFYDGKKLCAVLCDEEGKTETTDIDNRWMVLRNCLSLGDGAHINGYSYHPSTAEEYTSGGAAFQSMMNKSSFYQRKPNGQTQSGLFRLFMRSDEGLEGFIDSYGISVKDRILEYQKGEGFKQTATEYILDDFEYLLKQDTPESLVEYRKKKKQFPMSWADVWTGDTGNIGFPTELISERISTLRKKELTIAGNFEWRDGIFGNTVIWESTNEGRWDASRLFEEMANRRIRDVIWDPIEMREKETWAPQIPSRGTIGADPFKYKTKLETKKSHNKSTLSDGGITALWEHDERLDKDRIRSEWESEDIVCTYRYRAKTDDEFCEDVLKTAIWYGWQVYPEMNIEIIEKNFRLWGYEGYLKYDIGPDTKIKEYPGCYIHGQNKQEAFNMMRTFLQYHCHKIKHMRLLEECRDITAIEDLRNYDTLASCMVALLGSRSQYAKILQRVSEDSINISDLEEFFHRRIY